MRLVLENFSIAQIANSGQCFRINPLPCSDGNLWTVSALGKILQIKAISNNEYIFNCSEEEYYNAWMDYFDLARDYGNIQQKILSFNDPFLSAAAIYGSGIRILKQDLWEVIISFIISQRNSIKRIQHILQKLCRPWDGIFPPPEALADYDEQKFTELGVGYRARYLTNIVRAANDGALDLNFLKTLDTPSAIDYLRQFHGIGTKVANCIVLYGLHHMDAFPIDIWMRRIIDKYYGGNFDYHKFSQYAGLVQQYMFFYERNN